MSKKNAENYDSNLFLSLKKILQKKKNTASRKNFLFWY